MWSCRVRQRGTEKRLRWGRRKAERRDLPIGKPFNVSATFDWCQREKKGDFCDSFQTPKKPVTLIPSGNVSFINKPIAQRALPIGNSPYR